AVMLAMLAVAPAVAHAGLGDLRSITGQITMWGPTRFDQQIGVVQDDEGNRWVVRFGPGTLPDGAAVGTEIMLMARETALPSELLLLFLLLALFGLFLFMVEIRALSYAYRAIGISPRWVTAVLLLTLLGSHVNVPVTVARVGDTVSIIAVNVGGALIPVLVS